MADQTISIIIEMLARGDGAKVTQEQIRELNRLAHESGEEGNKARDALLSLSTAGVALAGAFKLAASGVREFTEKQEAIVALDAALAQQGNLVDEVRQKYQALADELENVTNIAGDRWVQVLATLTKFGAQPGEIEPYTEAVKNLAGFMGEGIESAAFTFGKAISGNVDILKRYGIEVDENTSKQEKLNQIMVQLAQRGGGQLEARAATLKGGFAGLREATNNVLEGIGNLIDRTHVLSVGLHVLTGIARGLAMMLPSTVEQSAQLNNKFKDLSQSAGEAGQAAEAAQQRIKEAVDKTNESLKAQLGDLHRIRQFHDSLNDEETGAKLAQVDMDEAEGKMLPHEANARRAEIRRNAQARKISEENIATVKARDALLAQRVGATESTDNAGAKADGADANVATFAKSIGIEDLGSLPSRFGKLSNERKKAAPERRDEIDQQLADLTKLNGMMVTAKEAETKYQESLAQQKKIWDGTADALKSVNDQLAIIQAKWNRLGAEAGADSARSLKGTGEFVRQEAERVRRGHLAEIEGTLGGAGLDPNLRTGLEAFRAKLRIQGLRAQESAPGTTPGQHSEIEGQVRQILLEVRSAFQKETLSSGGGADPRSLSGGGAFNPARLSADSQSQEGYTLNTTALTNAARRHGETNAAALQQVVTVLDEHSKEIELILSRARTLNTMNTHEPSEQFLQSVLAGEARGLAIAIWPDLIISDPFHNLPNVMSGRLLHEALALTLRAQGVRITGPLGDESIVDQPTAALLFPSLTIWWVQPFPVAFRATVALLEKTSLLKFSSVGYYDRAEEIWRSAAPAAPFFDLHWFVEHHTEIMRPILARQIEQKAVFDQWMAARKAQASQDHK